MDFSSWIRGLIAAVTIVFSSTTFATIPGPEYCTVVAVLHGDPQYFWMWGRDSWKGSASITCASSMPWRYTSSGVSGERVLVVRRGVRLVSWTEARAAGPDSRIRVTLFNLTRERAVSLIGTFRMADGKVETDVGLIDALVEDLSGPRLIRQNWNAPGQLTINNPWEE